MLNQTCAVIVSYNSPEELNACINSALSQVAEIIIIDNNSQDNVKRIIANYHYKEKISFIFNETNMGLGAALNQGIEYSLKNGYAWTLLLDQDSILSDNMIAEMIVSYNNLAAEVQKQTVIVVPVIYDKFLKVEFPAIITSKFLNKKIIKPGNDCFIHFQITSGSLLKNESIEQVGAINESLFIDYLDFDFCFRLLEKNYKILLSKNALLYHSLGQKRRKLWFHFIEHNPVRVYYQTRNRLILLYKYGARFRSFFYSEVFRFISKFFKIIILESDKTQKIKMYFKGIRDAVPYYKISMRKTERTDAGLSPNNTYGN